MAVMKKITLNFTPQEFDAIVDLAIAQHREPKQQAAFLVRQQLENLMLLPPTPTPLKEAAHDRQPA